MTRFLILTAALVLASCGQSDSSKLAMSSGVSETCKSRGELDWGGPIELINQDGETVTEADFKGKHSLVFFGFTKCADACPVIMQTIMYSLEDLPENLEKPRTILISFDPETDTPEQLKSYVENDFYPDDMVGLTGSEDAIATAAEEFMAKYVRLDDKDSAMGYTYSHTIQIYLMDENWEMETFFLPTENPRDISKCLTEFLPPVS